MTSRIGLPLFSRDPLPSAYPAGVIMPLTVFTGSSRMTIYYVVVLFSPMVRCSTEQYPEEYTYLGWASVVLGLGRG